MMDSLTLTWPDVKHTLVFTRRRTRVRGVLNVIKPKGEKRIIFTLPAVIMIETIEAAWKSQGEKWDQFFLFRGRPFIAKRAIWILGGCILWDVLHEDDAAYDNCMFCNLPQGTLKNIVIEP